MRHFWLRLFVSAGMVFVAAGCGGGGGGSSSGGGNQPVNSPPTWSSTAPSSAKEGHTYSYAMAAQDVNSDPLTFTLVSGPSGASASGSTLTWVPTTAQVGAAQSFIARASDGKGGTADQNWSVTPTTDAAPVFTTSAPTSGSTGAAYTYLAGATDADGDTVTYTLTVKPAWATITGNSISGTPSVAGPYGFTLRASDGIKTTDQSWTVTVTQQNSAPTWSSTAPSSAKEGHTYSYAMAAQDANSDPLTFTLVSGPTGASVSGNTLTWVPTTAQVGTSQAFLARVSDGMGGTADQNWSVTPTADAAPVFTSSAPTSGSTGSVYTYTAGATDADGDTVIYTLTAKPVWATLTGNSLSGTPSIAGPYGFTLRASDGIKTTDQSWTVSVTPAGNHAPVITSAPLTLATGGQPYTYFVTATDADGDAISYQLIAGPTGAALNGSVLTWTPSSSQERISSSFTVTATDIWGAASAPQTWTITPTGTIQGSSAITYLPLNWATRTITPTPIPNPSNPQISAIVPNGSGGLSTVIGYFNPSDGSYSISGVPGGKYWLSYNNYDFIWTDKSQVDLGWTVSGRPDQTPASISPTNVVFNMSGMNAWNDNDFLEYYDFNSNVYETPNNDAQTGWPNAGDTALAGMTVDWTLNMTYANNLTDMTKGDAPQLVQMVTQTSGTTSFQVAKKQFNPAGLTMIDGVGATISGSFSNIPLTSSFTFNWQGSAFAQYGGAVTPYGTPSSVYLDLVGTPGRAAFGNANSLDFLWYYKSGAATDLDLGTIAVPAMPQGFEASCLAHVAITRHFQLPGTTASSPSTGSIYVETNALPTAISPLQPLVSPVQNPSIGGQSIANDLSSTGIQPTIVWNPPVLGAPSGYLVSLIHLSISGTKTIATLTARLYTSTTSVTLPPGLMTLGEAYYLGITAVESSGWDPGTAPYRATKSIPYGSAGFISGIIRP